MLVSVTATCTLSVDWGLKEVMDKVARLFNGQVGKRCPVPDASLRHGHST